ncbi:MAG: hypothetical protein CMO01_25020, partial [Thalassobius sp.]|nr:hypothetical protein [Thalassovita sp.]
MYPEHLTAPMKQQLVSKGFKDLKTADEVTELLEKE